MSLAALIDVIPAIRSEYALSELPGIQPAAALMACCGRFGCVFGAAARGRSLRFAARAVCTVSIAIAFAACVAAVGAIAVVTAVGGTIVAALAGRCTVFVTAAARTVVFAATVTAAFAGGVAIAAAIAIVAAERSAVISTTAGHRAAACGRGKRKCRGNNAAENQNENE